METGGSNALAALASYFSEPSRTTAPTADELFNNEELWTSYPFKISPAGEDILVFVIDEEINGWKFKNTRNDQWITMKIKMNCLNG